MPDSVETSLLKVLNGEALVGEEAEICDFTLEDQNEALESQGIQPRIDPNYKPIVGETINYIVACVILNEHGDVLMMQEAKQSCAGKWYLPAGRMEKGETIVEACKREVLEETGLEIECTTLIMVECAGGMWIRFILTGKQIGGTLKTPAQADKESLQAKWVSNMDELTLRATDILELIERTRAYAHARKIKDPTWHLDQLPSLRAYPQIFLRVVIVIKKKATNRTHILLSERTSWHLPCCQINPGKSFHSTLRKFMVDLFGAEVPVHKPHGLLSVEHDPRNGQDGACLTLLVSFKSPLEEVPIIGKCVWHEVSKDLGDKLIQRVVNRNATFPIRVIK
ncbi:8-oxo-dGDP phosphatase NUDT18 [Anthonomus grandis grandis]|uniref:8-oxo-dGDP phosphatase NUDT18 n=1 Tax=Anthonomus grandis grandis TaxID=2921223 RepID=UPI002166745F|nr:8-oxo-dGDP phosphatase NUDT18 [Anthonomus grandis grandis]XP_050314239.1 8-oxo-dGDP phosphatase NUDT18 [Anthonomus grandis grandis]